MATIQPSYGLQATIISTELNSLADTSSTSSTSEVDNTTDLYIDGFLDCYFNGAAATTGSVHVYALTGNATGELSTTANLSNMKFLGSIELNGTTAVRKQLYFTGIPKYWKLRCVNESGAALAATGNIIKLTGLNYIDA